MSSCITITIINETSQVFSVKKKCAPFYLDKKIIHLYYLKLLT